MRTEFVMLAVGALLLWSSPVRAQCGGGGVRGAFGLSEYLYCGSDASWTAANADCATAAPGWTLTRIDSSGEDAFVRGLGGGDLWIGGDDQAIDGEWRWRDGDQFWQGDDNGTPVGGLYNNWSGGQPNAGADEDCARMKGDGTWEDRKCVDTERYVCEGPPICGSGARGAGEECDDGNVAAGDGCSPTCTLEGPAPCGDGRIWLGEQCDDGGTVGGDGCSSTCQIEEAFTCAGEPSTCSPICTSDFGWLSRAGSTTTEYFLCEQSSHATGNAETVCESFGSGWALARIDDAAENSYIDGLIGNHLWIGGRDEAVEGQWRWRDGEQFWQGGVAGTPVGGLYTNWKSGEPGGGTTENCLRQENGGLWQDRKCTDGEKFICEGPPICGNGVTALPEECDDGNTADGDGCSATCTLESPPPCGDGLLWLGEECDDGGTLGGDGCSSTCEIEPGYSCTGQPSTCTPDCTDNFEWHGQMGSTSTEYFLCEKSTTTSLAEAMCEGLGSGWTLARINDATENAYIDGFIGNHVWVGGRDQAAEGVWRWRDGVQFWQGGVAGTPVGGLYTNWKSGEPGGGTTENCLRQENGGLWQDRKCNDNEKFVCEGPPICGNGAVAMPEQCDDGNTADGDGCSSGCEVESGYECFLPDDAGTPSVCQLSAHVVIGRVELLEVRGEPVLQWETTSQSGTLGFVVSRQGREGWEPLHEGILLALPGAPQGGVYSLRDSGASTHRPASYRLEEIEIDGARRPIGEWQLVARSVSAPELLDVDYDAVPHALAPRHVDASTELAQKSTVLTPSSRVVLDVKQDGAIEVSVAALAERFGESPAEVRNWVLAGDVQITDETHQVPWWFDEARDGLFFVGEAPTSVYGATRPYVVRNAPGRRMPLDHRETAPTPPGVGTTRHVVDPNVFPALVASPDPESDYWFAASLSAGATGYGQYQTVVGLPDAPIEAALLRVHLYGGWNLSGESAQRVAIEVNAIPVDTVELAALGPHVFEMPVDPTLLRPVDNQLLLRAESDVAPGVSGIYVDRFELEIDRTLTAEEAELQFTAPADGPLTVEIQSASAHLLDLTGQKRIGATVVSDPVSGMTSVSFEAEQGHRYLVFDTARAPDAIRGAVDLRAPPGGASYLVIAPAAWADTAGRFAALHATDGLSTAVVSIESLYDAYGHSVATPHAIHDFLVDAHLQWVEAPRFVLLLGDGTLDYRGLMGVGPGAIAPRMVRATGGLYASDALLGDLDDDGLADIAVGRIPAQTREGADAAFEALERYQALEVDEFGPDGLMISGVSRGADFAGSIDRLLQTLPSALDMRWIQIDLLGTEQARGELIEELELEPFWMHYTGHGGLDRFDDRGVLASADLPTLQPALPLIVTAMTCSTSRFELPGVDALAEHMVDPANSFAIATWGPSGLTMSNDAATLGEAFAAKLFSSDGETARLGDLIVALHQEPAPAYDPDALAVYVLLGDPALRLKSRPDVWVGSPVDLGVEPPSRPDSGSTAPTSSQSAGGCAVGLGGDSLSLPWLMLALLWLGRRSTKGVEDE